MKKLTTEGFIRRAKEAHGNKYDYSKSEYINSREKISIICPKHGEFWQLPFNHINGQNCPKCNKSWKMNTSDFIEKARKIHGDKYDYSNVNYINSAIKVKIICPKHGAFLQRPAMHLIGQGCPKCSKNHKLSIEEFVNRARKIHGNKYSYPIFKNVSGNHKVEIICPIHGKFYQTKSAHVHGQGCPKCNQSHGENKIDCFLKYHNIKYIRQYKIRIGNSLFSINNVKVDFYLPNNNLIIEYNGEQHYMFIKHFHKDYETFIRKQTERDLNLKKWCKSNNVKLLIISYKQYDKIDKILLKELTR